MTDPIGSRREYELEAEIERMRSDWAAEVVRVRRDCRKELASELERLRSIAFGAEEYAQTVRRATIEQCARILEQANDETSRICLIAAIRALK